MYKYKTYPMRQWVKDRLSASLSQVCHWLKPVDVYKGSLPRFRFWLVKWVRDTLMQSRGICRPMLNTDYSATVLKYNNLTFLFKIYCFSFKWGEYKKQTHLTKKQPAAALGRTHVYIDVNGRSWIMHAIWSIAMLRVCACVSVCVRVHFLMSADLNSRKCVHV